MKKILKTLLVLAILTVPAIQTFAATGDKVSYSFNMYSGVVKSTSTGINYNDRATVTYTSGGLGSINAQVSNYNGSKVSSYQTVQRGGNQSYYDVCNYPGDSVYANLVKYGIEGKYTVSGNFYYDGI